MTPSPLRPRRNRSRRLYFSAGRAPSSRTRMFVLTDVPSGTRRERVGLMIAVNDKKRIIAVPPHENIDASLSERLVKTLSAALDHGSVRLHLLAGYWPVGLRMAEPTFGGGVITAHWPRLAVMAYELIYPWSFDRYAPWIELPTRRKSCCLVVDLCAPPSPFCGSHLSPRLTPRLGPRRLPR